MLDFQKFFQEDEDEDEDGGESSREGKEEEVTKGKVEKKKTQEGLERFL